MRQMKEKETKRYSPFTAPAWLRASVCVCVCRRHSFPPHRQFTSAAYSQSKGETDVQGS